MLVFSSNVEQYITVCLNLQTLSIVLAKRRPQEGAIVPVMAYLPV
jgi:hypothetical protein